MMRMRMLAVGAAAVAAAVFGAGCDGSSCDEIEHVISAETAAPGEVRSGILLRAPFAAVAPRATGGVVCVTCSGLARLDADLRDDGQIGSLDEPRHVAVALDGTAYTSIQRPREDKPSQIVHEIIAFGPGGVERWRLRSGEPSPPQRMVADAARLYVQWPGRLVAFDSATGDWAWSRPDELLGVAREGVFVKRGTTVRHMGRNDAVIWERSMTSQSTVFTIHDAAVTPDGGAVVVGRAESTIDFGDRVLEGEPGRALNFVVEIDPTGATRWAMKVDVALLEHVAVTETGELLLAGRHAFSLTKDSRLDSFLALATRDGIVRKHIIGGPGDQLVEDLYVSTAGHAWVQISSRDGEIEGDPDPELRVGRARLGEDGSYLLEIVP